VDGVEVAADVLEEVQRIVLHELIAVIVRLSFDVHADDVKLSVLITLRAPACAAKEVENSITLPHTSNPAHISRTFLARHRSSSPLRYSYCSRISALRASRCSSYSASTMRS
jgi:Cu/Ag efflux pump CusA